MTAEEPSRSRILLYSLAGTLVPSIWSEWVNRLGLLGGERVLEVGAGPGIAARFIAERLQSGGGRLTCTDISSGWLDVARRRLRGRSNVEFLLGDVGTLSLPDAAYDVTSVHFVLHEVPILDRVRVLTVLREKCKLDGRLFLREPLHESMHSISEDEIRRSTQRAGWIERESRISRVPILGIAFEGIYGKAPLASRDRMHSAIANPISTD